MTRAILPYMRERRTGSIVNIGSLAGYTGFGGCGLYAATKFAVTGVSESLKAEVAPFGIEVHCIEPGYFATSLLEGGNLAVNRGFDCGL